MTDIELPIRLAQCIGITASSALAGASLSISFIAVPRLLESPPHLLLKQWNNLFQQGKAFFPIASLVPAGSFFFLAYKQTSKLKLKLFAAAGALAVGIIPYTLLCMMSTNTKLLGKVDEAQVVYANQSGGDWDDVSSGSGRKHKKSSKDRERSDRSYKKSSSSRRKPLEEEGDEDVRTAHELVDRWALLNVGRGIMMIASAAVGTWTVCAPPHMTLKQDDDMALKIIALIKEKEHHRERALVTDGWTIRMVMELVMELLASRAAARTLRAPIRRQVRQTRFVSTTQAEGAKAGGASGFAAGVAGGAVVLAGCYTYYQFSGAKTVVNAYSSTKNQFHKATSALSEKAPEPNQAIKWLRNATSSYAAFIPGAQSFLDGAFNDIEKVQEKHGKEVDDIVNKTYADLKDISKKGGVDMQTAVQGYNILTKALNDIAELGKDSLGDIMENHPQIKEKLGGNLDQLKSMAENYGPEAKKELDDTYKKVSEILAGGLGVGSIDQVRKLIQEKSDKVKKLGEQAWNKGLEEWKPYLEKNPQVKEIVEKNADALKSGNVKEIFDQVRQAIDSGNTDNLQKYIKEAGEKAKSKGSGLGGYAQQAAQMAGIPGADKMWERLQRLQEVARENGGEVEGLLKSAFEEISGVVEKKVKEAEKLKGKVERDAKK
ncbi:hypothetical protein SBOR_0020 [Sclerotinia borealis F-4128]|uniref:Uncharacterized protein n=1 Tax=Sclerotinia borealis (strain F-4128) TaxID=1432307 RepID=W9CY62_SCLBF|nr:hypothetical protein SBOR_0020 [Sclerotinia borealis F-4128]